MTLRTTQRDCPIDPIPCAFGSFLPIPGGRIILQFDPLDADAPDEARHHANRILATLADMGHVAFVGEQSQYAIVRESCREELS